MEPLSENVIFHYLELTKVTKDIKQLKTPLEQWCFYINHADTLSRDKMDQLEELNSIFKEANINLKTISQYRDFWLEYDKRQYDRRSYAKNIHDAEQTGEDRGKSIGEKERSLKIAANMVQSKVEPAFICKMTGLSQEEVERLFLVHENNVK